MDYQNFLGAEIPDLLWCIDDNSKELRACHSQEEYKGYFGRVNRRVCWGQKQNI
jgi:hypothetical protein